MNSQVEGIGSDKNDAEQDAGAAQPPAGTANETNSSFDDQLDWLVDEAMKESFPASDPPCWTLGREPLAEADPLPQTKEDDEETMETD